MAFRIVGLQAEQFRAIRSLGDDELAARGVIRVVANEKPGFPCRVTLRDAEIGETLLLLNYEHQAADTPYRSAHAIFVSESAEQFDDVDRVPQALRDRMLSVRAFDAAGMMLDADLVDGAELEGLIERLFEDERAAYLHVHYAKRGCFAARVERL